MFRDNCNFILILLNIIRFFETPLSIGVDCLCDWSFVIYSSSLILVYSIHINVKAEGQIYFSLFYYEKSH